MIKREFGVFSRYEFQRSAVAVCRRETEREGDVFVTMTGDREGIEVPTFGTMSVGTALCRLGGIFVGLFDAR